MEKDKAIKIDNIVFIIFMIFIFVAPFGVIGQYHGWILSVFFAISFLVSVLLIAAQMSSSEEFFLPKSLFFTYIFFPFVYALFLLGNIKGIGAGLIITTTLLNIYLIYQSYLLIKKHKLRQTYPFVTLQFPHLTPFLNESTVEISEGDSTSSTRNICRLTFPTSYNIDNQHFVLEEFTYTWIAPEKDPLKKLNYKLELKGKDFLLRYNPENPNQIHKPITDKELDDFIRGIWYSRKRNGLTAFVIVLIGLLLLIFG